MGIKQTHRSGTKVPAEILQELRSDTLRAGVRLAHLEQACTGIVERTTSAGIPVLVLKGLALAATVYPPGIPRPMDDIDLLVREEDWEGLAEILRAQGYRNDLRGEEDFFHPSLAFSLDVHTAPVNITRIPARRAVWPATFEELWGRRQTFGVNGNLLSTLSPLDTVTHLAVHAVHHHGLAGHLWMVDLVACLDQPGFDPGELGGTHPSVRRSLWYCLEAMIVRSLHFPDLQSRLCPRHLYPGERRLVAAASRGALPEAVRYAFTFCCLADWRQRLTYLRQICFPCSDVFRTGFSDAGNRTPGRGTIWRMAFGLGWSIAFHSISQRFRRHRE